jgi:hypothetical protein
MSVFLGVFCTIIACALYQCRSHKRTPEKVDIKSTDNMVRILSGPAIDEPATEFVHLTVDDYDMCGPVVE